MRNPICVDHNFTYSSTTLLYTGPHFVHSPTCSSRIVFFWALFSHQAPRPCLSLPCRTMTDSGGTLQNYNSELVNCIEEVPAPRLSVHAPESPLRAAYTLPCVFTCSCARSVRSSTSPSLPTRKRRVRIALHASCAAPRPICEPAPPPRPALHPATKPTQYYACVHEQPRFRMTSGS